LYGRFCDGRIKNHNGMPNIPSCSTIVTLKASNSTLITNFCTALKLINNTKFNAVGIKSLSGSCDLKIEDKASYMNCSDKTSQERSRL
jgi:hypothetical protein